LYQDVLEKIDALKKKHNAVILAHNYQPGEIQDIADYCGDSLGLSVQAAKTDADVIVFCGVLFMAETAAILSPDKIVLLPEIHAGCPMADMITADELAVLKAKHPDAVVVCYVNSSAEVKAQSDYCCTSSNAVALVDQLPKDAKIIFVPDQHLGAHVAKNTGRNIILWPGYCPSHVVITVEDIEHARGEYPNAVVLTHPECSEPVKEISDELLSTGQMLSYARQHPNGTFIIATEKGILHTLKKQNPNSIFVGVTPKAICPNMKKISLDKIIESFEKMQYRISIPPDISRSAKKSLERMIEVLPN
jgi:quinolinate synthase